MEDGVLEVPLEALKKQDRRACVPHGWQDHGYRRTGVRIDPSANYLRPPAQSVNEIQQLPVVAKTVDLEPHSREPVFDAPPSLAERVSFGRAARVQHTEQILHGVGQRLFSSAGACWITKRCRQTPPKIRQSARRVVALTTSFTPIAAKPRDSRLGTD